MKYILLLTALLTSGVFASELDDYKNLADEDIVYAQFFLGVMYDIGDGVPENDAEAVKWYRKAAEQGDADAQSNLGFMYDNGRGVPGNDIKAHVWYSMAKTSGNEKAKKNLRILKTEMTKDQIAQAQELATKCYESNYKDCD